MASHAPDDSGFCLAQGPAPGRSQGLSKHLYLPCFLGPLSEEWWQWVAGGAVSCPQLPSLSVEHTYSAESCVEPDNQPVSGVHVWGRVLKAEFLTGSFK